MPKFRMRHSVDEKNLPDMAEIVGAKNILKYINSNFFSWILHSKDFSLSVVF
jgi:hypothetical protein